MNFKALVSFGKQLPPYPIPAFRKLEPIRSSYLIPSCNIFNICAHQLTEICNLIHIGNFQSQEIITGILNHFRRTPAYGYYGQVKGFVNFPGSSSSAFLLSVPITMRAACKVSWTADPCARNSGLDATSMFTSL